MSSPTKDKIKQDDLKQKAASKAAEQAAAKIKKKDYLTKASTVTASITSLKKRNTTQNQAAAPASFESTSQR
jgi:hypothetical protein